MPDKIILADDSAFFVKTIDVPAPLSDTDAREFVRAWVENSSPMPVEKMRVGFARFGGAATIFAGIENRVFGGLDTAAVASADYLVAPSSLLLFCGARDEKIILRSERAISLLEFENGIIRNFWTQSLSEDVAADLKSLRAAASSGGGERLCSILKVSLNGRAYVKIADFDEESFVASTPSEGAVSEYQIAKKTLALLDVRDGNILKTLARKRRKSEMKALAFMSVPCAFALLLAGQVLLWVKESKLSALEAEVAELAPKAKAVEEQSERLAELRMFSQKRLRAIDSLAVINVPRTDQIRFLRVVQTSPSDLEIQGGAPTIGEVNSFLKSLRRMPEVRSAEMKTETTRGEARFTLNVKLK